MRFVAFSLTAIMFGKSSLAVSAFHVFMEKSFQWKFCCFEGWDNSMKNKTEKLS